MVINSNIGYRMTFDITDPLTGKKLKFDSSSEADAYLKSIGKLWTPTTPKPPSDGGWKPIIDPIDIPPFPRPPIFGPHPPPMPPYPIDIPTKPPGWKPIPPFPLPPIFGPHPHPIHPVPFDVTTPRPSHPIQTVEEYVEMVGTNPGTTPGSRWAVVNEWGNVVRYEVMPDGEIIYINIPKGDIITPIWKKGSQRNSVYRGPFKLSGEIYHPGEKTLKQQRENLSKILKTYDLSVSDIIRPVANNRKQSYTTSKKPLISKRKVSRKNNKKNKRSLSHAMAARANRFLNW